MLFHLKKTTFWTKSGENCLFVKVSHFQLQNQFTFFSLFPYVILNERNINENNNNYNNENNYDYNNETHCHIQWSRSALLFPPPLWSSCPCVTVTNMEIPFHPTRLVASSSKLDSECRSKQESSESESINISTACATVNISVGDGVQAATSSSDFQQIFDHWLFLLNVRHRDWLSLLSALCFHFVHIRAHFLKAYGHRQNGGVPPEIMETM